jgi:tRNA (uracil-5-)-methyltransferase TRM9
MDASTIQRLNALNQNFYRMVGESFDRTRGHPWPGWDRVWDACRDVLWPYFPTQNTFSVLDMGCGNGRFGVFMAERLAEVEARTGHDAIHRHVPSLRYHGMDTDAALLDRAREALAGTNVIVNLEQRDVITQPPDSGQYDLVALFGVVHHVPGSETRRALLRSLAERVAPGGRLAFACWRFLDYRRFRDRIVPWPDDLAGEVEAGDHLLDWRRGAASALRYCHHVDDVEHTALIAATGLAEIDSYRADGRSGDMNRYSILKKTWGADDAD